MKIRITKAEVLKAIKEEPLLSPGWWFSHRTVGAYDPSPVLEGMTAGDTTNCKVCAVGAVFRRTLRDNLPALDANDILKSNLRGIHISADGANGKLQMQERARRELRHGHHWNALSVMFEGLCDLYDVKSAPVYMDSPDDTADRAALFASLTKVREELAQFVTETFPDDLTMEVPDSGTLKGPYKEFTQ